ncbi:hypothetical protein Tco_1008691 [Tanacetum coccineum]
MSSYNHFGCSYCGGPFNGGNCPSCRSVGSGDEFVYDPNPYSYNETPNFFNQPPQYQYETYSCEFCGGDFHPGYDCQTGNTPVFDQGPCYNQDFGFNQPLHYFPSQPQQILCDNCGVLHENVQCQPMNQNYDLNFCYDPIYSGFDQYQPPQFSEIHHPQATDTELLQARENLMEAIEAFLKEYDHIPPEEKCMALLLAEERFLKIKQVKAAQEKQVPSPNSVFRQLIEETCGTKVCEEEKQNMEDTMLDLLKIYQQKELYYIQNNVDDLFESALNSKLLSINSQHLDKEKQEVKNTAEPTAKHQTRISPCLKNFKVIHKESIIPLNKMPQISSVNAITPNLLTVELEDSLVMGDEHLSTIPKKESDEFIKSSVENLVPIPRESEDTSGSDSKSILPSSDDFSPIFEEKSVTFSNPLFDSNDFTSSDNELLSDEDVPEDVKIYSNPLFEFDDEYISSDVNPLFDEVLENIESKDSYVSNLDEPALLVTPLSDANEDECFDPGGVIDEIDAFLDMDISTDIENGYHDSEGDIIYLESLLIDDTSPNLPPEVFLDHDPRSLKDEPDNDDLMTEDKVFDPGIHEKSFSPTFVKLTFEDRHYFPITFVIRIFLPYLTYSVDSSFLLSFGSEDTIFDPGISTFHFSSLKPVAYENPMVIFPFFSHKNKCFSGGNPYLFFFLFS